MAEFPPPPPTPYGSAPSGGGNPQVGSALSYGFHKYGANVGPVLAVLATAFVAELVVNLLEVSVSSVIGRLLFTVVGFVVGAAISLGIYQTALIITMGERPTISRAFSYDRWGEWLGFSIVYGLMVGLGLVACVIPGLFILAFFGMAPFFFIDRRMSLGQALSASREAASSRGFALPVLLAIIVGALGLIACGIGVLVTAPAAYIAVAFLYRAATGQPVAP